MKIKNILLTSILVLSSAIVTKIGVKEEKINIIHNANEAYYAAADTSTGAKLMESLETILNAGARDIGYGGLWEAYKKTDVRPGTNTIWDMYSNCKFDADRDHGGSYSKEGDMFNREHSIPQSWFNEASPMKADLFHVYPTDGYVNNRRSSYPFGEVSNPTYTSGNGSKVGHSSFEGYSGTVFEPIDEYKGDFARTYFYMATRYRSKVGGWTKGEAQKVFKGSYPYLTDYAVNLFSKWAHEDPVSEKEINRNDAVYGIQKNRNPYIDHPEYIDIAFPSKYSGTTPTPSDEYKIILDAAGGTFASNIVTLYTVKNGESQVITLPTKDQVTAPNGVGTLKNFTDGTNTYEAGATITISSKTTIRAVYDIPAALSVADAVAICQKTGENATTISYTVIGTVKEIKEVSEQYKNATFVITDGVNDITVFRADINNSYELKVGDNVKVSGPLVNYKGNTPEFTKNGDLRVSYSLSNEAPITPAVKLETISASFETALNIRYSDEVFSVSTKLLVSTEKQENTNYYLIITDADYDTYKKAYVGQTTVTAFCNALNSTSSVELLSKDVLISIFDINTIKKTDTYVYLVAEDANGIKSTTGLKINDYEQYQANYALYSEVQKQIIDKYFNN